jgi:hypothetical protein
MSNFQAVLVYALLIYNMILTMSICKHLGILPIKINDIFGVLM